MRLSLHLGKYYGIPVNVHWSFIFLPMITIYWALQKGADFTTISILLGLVFLIFICVVLHEFGHALMAKRYGVKTKDILLLPICGMARLERLPEKPLHELLVAIAGPMVNLGIALLVAISLLFIPKVSSSVIGDLSNAQVSLISLPFILVAFNLAMVVFNLFPIFPMDGGRILRSLLAMKLDQSRATRWASYVGQFFSVLIIIAGLWISDYLLALTGVFVFMLATREQRIVDHNEYMHQTPVKSLVNTDFTLLNKHDLVALAKNQIAGTSEQFFLVADESEQVCGYVSRAAIESAKYDVALTELLSHLPKQLSYDSTLAEISTIFKKYRVPIFAIMKEDKLYGVLEID